MLKDRRRPDGRKFDEIRKIDDAKSGVLPRTHGSALFTRGETQALVTATLGTKDDEQRIELLDLGETSKRFMLHYNFPPFSVGEVGFMRGAGRREIGHGALAERRCRAVVPDDEDVPLHPARGQRHSGIERFQLDGSVCGATLALMDAGVPITAPVAGIAMGLVMEGDDYAVLTDIAGAEDHYGDMDFKVAGTSDGITGPADGHQGAERHARHHEGSAGAGAQRPAAHPRQDGCGAIDKPRDDDVAVRSAHLHADRFRPTRSAS